MQGIIRAKYRILRLLSKLLILFMLLPLAYNYIPVKKGKEVFFLPESTIESVIDTLHEHGYGVSFIDKVMLQFFTPPPEGWYHIQQVPKERFRFFEQLKEQKAKTMRVKIYAGETSIELSKRLAHDLKLDDEKLLREYRRLTKYLEGDILAGYYTIARKADERAVMTALFQESAKRFRAFAQTHCTQTQPHELEFKILLILASIIQKETYHKDEMPLIASVIENRLNRGMKLQMDGTLNYGEYAHKPITASRIRKDKSYYNTYIHGGIPPAPLSTVSIDALKAALYPKKTNYLYFMLNKQGRHNFSATYKEHLQNIKAFRKKKKQKEKKEATSSA